MIFRTSLDTTWKLRATLQSFIEASHDEADLHFDLAI